MTKTLKRLIDSTKRAPVMRGPKEQALKAKREEKALDIPAILKRQPETPEQADARRAKQAKAEERKRFADSAGLKVRKPPEPVDPKIAKAIARDLKERDPMRVGKMSPAMAKALEIVDRNNAKPPIKVAGPDLGDGPGLARLRKSTNAETLRKEHVMATKKASKVSPKSQPKTKSKPSKSNGKGPSKREIAVNMVLRKQGTTCAEACKELGWQVLNRSTLFAYCKQAGVKVRTEAGKDDKPDRYFAA